MAEQITRLVDSQTKEVIVRFNHLEACPHCDKHSPEAESGCKIFPNTAWVNRRGGCGHFPERGMSPARLKRRVGQQKQSHQDRSYTSKNERKAKYRGY